MTDMLDRLKSALADKYAVEREIGQGGMATVYLANDLKHNRKVAVKVVAPELAASLGWDRFLREIEIAAGLSHPHILPLYDSGEAGGILYYVMPFVDGESVRDRLDREKQLPVKDALEIARAVADGLTYAHSQDVIHRDIKPENIMLSGGHAVIADFGIARAISASGGERLTGTGLSVGTPSYMSPEQASGEQQLDGRSDLYSLGCVLYEMLAGEPPFTGPTVESIVNQHMVAPPPSVAILRPSVSADVAGAVQTAMAKAPADRQRSVTDFAEQLWRSLAHTVVSTTAFTSAERPSHAAGPGALDGVSLAKNLFERRVPHFFALYVVLSAVVVMFLDFLVNRFVLSPDLPDFGLVALASMMPAVVLVSYFHGRPGPSTVTRVEKIGIPANVGVMALFLFLNFNPADLGAATTTVTVQDEDGQSVERVVPKSTFRKKLALFNFENESGDSTADWLRFGIPVALDTDLDQDMFVTVQSMSHFAEELKQRGMPEGIGLPLTLQREIADDLHLPYFVAGSYTVDGQQYDVSLTLYDTRRARVLQERNFTGTDFFELMDEISVQLKHDLEIPAQHIEDVQDLPVSSIMTTSLSAYEAAVNGLTALIARDDWQAAAEHLERAVAEDSTFATVHATLYGVYLFGNDAARAQAALQKAMDYIYKLPERDQFSLKISYYDHRRQPDKVLAVAEMKVDLFPDDIEGRAQLAALRVMHNDRDGAIAQFRNILEIDPTQYDYLQQIGGLHSQLGEFDSALEYYERYAAQFPDNEESFTAIGDLYENLGRHADAKEQYDRASLLKPDDVGTLVKLADIERDLGNFEQAFRQLDDALAASKTPTDRAQVYSMLAALSEWKGQLAKTLEYQQMRAAETREVAPQIQILFDQFGSLDTYVKAGRPEQAFEILHAIEPQLTPPWTMLVPLAYLEIYLELENPDSAEAALIGVEQLIQALGVEALRPQVADARGLIHEMRGQFQEAIAQYQRELELAPTNFDAHTDMGRAYRQLGELDDAAEHINATLRVHPFDPEAHYELALVYADDGDSDKAREHLETALSVWDEADAQYRPAADARAKLAELQGGA